MFLILSKDYGSPVVGRAGDHCEQMLNVQELLGASCMFQVPSLKDACCEFMRHHLGVTNCLGVRAVADLHSCAQLRKIADDFARKNFTSVIESEEFLKLEVDHLINLFSSDDLGENGENSLNTVL